jgi:hypothetical protein
MSTAPRTSTNWIQNIAMMSLHLEERLAELHKSAFKLYPSLSTANANSAVIHQGSDIVTKM